MGCSVEICVMCLVWMGPGMLDREREIDLDRCRDGT